MTTELLIIVAVVVSASFIRGALGFGDALFAMPLLALVLPTKAAAPLVALAAATTALVLLLRDWRHVVLRPATLLTGFGVLGVPFGAWMLRTGDDRLVKGLLACVVLGFSVWSLRRSGLVGLKNDRLAPVFGFAAGFLGGAYNTGGPPLVVFGTLRHWTPMQFRATLQTYSIVASGWVIAIHSLTGLVTRSTLTHFGIVAPLIVVASLAGRRLTNEIPADRFVRLVYAALIVVGLWLAASCVFDVRPADETRGEDGNALSLPAPPQRALAVTSRDTRRFREPLSERTETPSGRRPVGG